LRRGALKLSVHLSLEGGTLERRELQQGQRKGKARVKGTSKGKVKARAKGTRKGKFKAKAQGKRFKG
jgi:hypothetical protein